VSQRAADPDEAPDFSLVLGGPLYQLLRRSRLAGDGLELMQRRMLVIAGIAWVPLLLLATLAGHALHGYIRVPFLYDIEVHVRFLVALPVLIAAELIVHQRLRPALEQFVKRRIVAPEDMQKFHAAIASTLRLRNSVALEVALIVLVYTVGHWTWRSQVALQAETWYGVIDSARLELTLAGYWYLFVSLPIFQFILVRWYVRIALWFSLLWRISRLDLRLMPFHPDRAGGLGFVGRSTDSFVPLVFAQGALLAGLIASQIFHAGHNLAAYKVEIVSLVAFFVAFIFSPLVVFMPHLVRAKREGTADSGTLATRYVQEFERKWVKGEAQAGEALIGSADLQSLADLDASCSVVREMRVVPFTWKDMTRVGVTAVVPLLPLSLTVFSAEELVGYLIKVLF
jgi:hypothetical protein